VVISRKNFARPPVQNVVKPPMQPAFASGVISPAVDVLVQHVRIVPAEPGDFLLQAHPSMFHERCVTFVPELAMTLNDSRHPIADRFDHVLVHHFAIKRRQFPMPVHDLRRSISG
jgi:hypothetical protein